MNILSKYLRNRAIIRFRLKLFKALAKDYGKSKYYTAEQVDATLNRNKISRRNEAFAFAMFCTQDVFASYCNENSVSGEYGPMRKVISDVAFYGQPDFKQTDISVASSVGGSAGGDYGSGNAFDGGGGDGGGGGGGD